MGHAKAPTKEIWGTTTATPAPTAKATGISEPLVQSVGAAESPGGTSSEVPQTCGTARLFKSLAGEEPLWDDNLEGWVIAWEGPTAVSSGQKISEAILPSTGRVGNDDKLENRLFFSEKKTAHDADVQQQGGDKGSMAGNVVTDTTGGCAHGETTALSLLQGLPLYQDIKDSASSETRSVGHSGTDSASSCCGQGLREMPKGHQDISRSSNTVRSRAGNGERGIEGHAFGAIIGDGRQASGDDAHHHAETAWAKPWRNMKETEVKATEEAAITEEKRAEKVHVHQVPFERFEIQRRQ